MKKADYLGSRALKGAMAVVLAVGLCPVAPAMAQEGATTSGEGGAESSSVEAPVDDAATSIDEAEAEENGAAQIEGASSANTSSPIDAASAVLPGESDQSSEWQSWGDCEWAVDADGCLTIRPKGGADFGALPDSFDSAVAPWCDDGCRQDIKSVYVSKGVKASRYSRGLFAQLSSAESMDVSNLDVSSAIDLGCMVRALLLVDISKCFWLGYVCGQRTWRPCSMAAPRWRRSISPRSLLRNRQRRPLYSKLVLISDKYQLATALICAQWLWSLLRLRDGRETGLTNLATYSVLSIFPRAKRASIVPR